MPLTEVETTGTVQIIVGIVFLVGFFLGVFLFARWTIHSQSDVDNTEDY